MEPDLPEEGWYVVDLIEEAEDEGPDSFGKLTEALAEADRLVESCWNSADVHYLRGYALFLLLGRGFAISREVMAEFELSLRLNPGHHWARYHVILLAYRMGRHGQAAGEFQLLDRDFFRGQDKDWRYLKAWEYSLCAQARLGLAESFRPGVEALMGEYLSAPGDPGEPLPPPDALIELRQDLGAGTPHEPMGDPHERTGDPAAFIEEQLRRLIPAGWVREEDLG